MEYRDPEGMSILMMGETHTVTGWFKQWLIAVKREKRSLMPMMMGRVTNHTYENGTCN
jgi:hypothetical protein